MAEEKKVIRRKNVVSVEGYLKENNLTIIRDKNNNEAIKGAITIAVNESDSHKIQFYASRFRKDKNGNMVESKNYTNLVALLPQNTLSIASYLQSNPQVNFATALSVATHVWATAQFDEFCTKNDQDLDVNYIMLKGQNGGVREADKPFNPRATFNVDVYIQSITPEIVDGDETGRLDLIGLIPHYSGRMMQIPFKVSNDKVVNNATKEEMIISQYVGANYNEHETANFKGNVFNTVKIVEAEAIGWGTSSSNQTTRKFIHERVITGGEGSPLDEDDDNAIHTEDVRDGLMLREEVRGENAENKSKKTAAAPKPAPATGGTAPAANVQNSPNSAVTFDFGDDDMEEF